MGSVSVAAVQWSKLRDIDDVEPLGDSDSDCLCDIREVLKKHGKLERFGVALLHSHFDLDSDEIMLECAGDEPRSLITKAVKREDADNSNVGTIWMLREGDVATMAWCRSYCYKEPILRIHSKSHNSVPGR